MVAIVGLIGIWLKRRRRRALQEAPRPYIARDEASIDRQSGKDVSPSASSQILAEGTESGEVAINQGAITPRVNTPQIRQILIIPQLSCTLRQLEVDDVSSIQVAGQSNEVRHQTSSPLIRERSGGREAAAPPAYES